MLEKIEKNTYKEQALPPEHPRKSPPRAEIQIFLEGMAVAHWITFVVVPCWGSLLKICSLELSRSLPWVLWDLSGHLWGQNYFLDNFKLLFSYLQYWHSWYKNNGSKTAFTLAKNIVVPNCTNGHCFLSLFLLGVFFIKQ